MQLAFTVGKKALYIFAFEPGQHPALPFWRQVWHGEENA
jgi:hypothetical protein